MNSKPRNGKVSFTEVQIGGWFSPGDHFGLTYPISTDRLSVCTSRQLAAFPAILSFPLS